MELPSVGLGVCFCWFHSGGEGVQGGLEGWAAAGAAGGSRREPEVQGVSSHRLLSGVNALNNNPNRSVINICNQRAVLND